jgi:hypothetical protein
MQIFLDNLTIEKVIDKFTSFLLSIRTLKYKFVWQSYGKNTELDRNKSNLSATTRLKRIRYGHAKHKLNQKYDPNQQKNYD